MKRNLLVFVLIAFSVVAMTGCKGNKRAKFEKYLEQNIEACAEPFKYMGVDDASARNLCDCMLNAMYDIDPNFFENEELMNNEFVESHMEELMGRCSTEFESLMGAPAEQVVIEEEVIEPVGEVEVIEE